MCELAEKSGAFHVKLAAASVDEDTATADSDESFIASPLSGSIEIAAALNASSSYLLRGVQLGSESHILPLMCV